jgi:hypothetical protein
MCLSLLLPVLREKVGMRVRGIDLRYREYIHRTNSHPALSRNTGRGEEGFGKSHAIALDDSFIQVVKLVTRARLYGKVRPTDSDLRRRT